MQIKTVYICISALSREVGWIDKTGGIERELVEMGVVCVSAYDVWGNRIQVLMTLECTCICWVTPEQRLYIIVQHLICCTSTNHNLEHRLL